MTEQKRMGRWYFGGLASAGAACCTHPLDLIKVQLQTKKDGNIGAVAQAKIIIRSEGFLALYNGLSASLVRQLTYSTTRFAIYEVAKQSVSPNGEPIPFTSRLGMAAIAGACGGFVGTPGDMTNVRMQNDMKLPPEQRRNYKHAIDGMARVYREEGLLAFWRGNLANILRYFTDISLLTTVAHDSTLRALTFAETFNLGTTDIGKIALAIPMLPKENGASNEVTTLYSNQRPKQQHT